MSEKKSVILKAISRWLTHPTIAPVVAGLLLMAIGSVLFWQTVKSAVLGVWHVLAYPVPVPLGLLVLLILCVVFVIVWVAHRLISPGQKRRYGQGERPSPPGRGLPVKRRKEEHWRERIQELIAKASEVGLSKARAIVWQREGYDALETLLFDPQESLEVFLERTQSIVDGKDITTAVERGVTYLRDIEHKDGGELN